MRRWSTTRCCWSSVSVSQLEHSCRCVRSTASCLAGSTAKTAARRISSADLGGAVDEARVPMNQPRIAPAASNSSCEVCMSYCRAEKEKQRRAGVPAARKRRSRIDRARTGESAPPRQGRSSTSCPSLRRRAKRDRAAEGERAADERSEWGERPERSLPARELSRACAALDEMRSRLQVPCRPKLRDTEGGRRGEGGRLRRDDRRCRGGEGAARGGEEGDDEAEQAEDTASVCGYNVSPEGRNCEERVPRKRKRGTHLEKISMTSTLTNSCGSDASAMAALAPEMPTATPHKRLHMPAVRPPQKIEYPV